MKSLKLILASFILLLGLSTTSVMATDVNVGGYLGGKVEQAAGQLGGAVNTVIDNKIDGFIEDLTGQKQTPSGELSLPDAKEFGKIGENTSFRLYLQRVVNFVLSFLGLIAVIFIIYAGYLYVTDGGGDGGKDKAKKIIVYVAIGIIVILASYAIVNTLIQEAPVGGDDRAQIENSQSRSFAQQDKTNSLFF